MFVFNRLYKTNRNMFNQVAREWTWKYAMSELQQVYFGHVELGKGFSPFAAHGVQQIDCFGEWLVLGASQLVPPFVLPLFVILCINYIVCKFVYVFIVFYTMGIIFSINHVSCLFADHCYTDVHCLTGALNTISYQFVVVITFLDTFVSGWCLLLRWLYRSAHNIM